MMAPMIRPSKLRRRAARRHPHSRYIELLGGPTNCAALLTAELAARRPSAKIVVTHNTVSNWGRRGVSGEMRAIFAAVLAQHGHPAPRNFTLPRRTERR